MKNIFAILTGVSGIVWFKKFINAATIATTNKEVAFAYLMTSLFFLAASYQLYKE